MIKFGYSIASGRKFQAALEQENIAQWGDSLFVLRLRDWAGVVRAYVEGESLPIVRRRPTRGGDAPLLAQDRDDAAAGRTILVLEGKAPYAWVVPANDYWHAAVERGPVQDDAWLAELGADFDPDVGTLREVAIEFGIDYRNAYQAARYVGSLKAFQAGGRWMCRRSEFKRWKAARRGIT